MVSKEVKKYGKVAEVLDESEYRKLEGLLRALLPIHVGIEIERKQDKIELWAKKPYVIKRALKKARNLYKRYGTDALSKAFRERLR